MHKEELIKYIKEPEKLQFKSLYDLMDVRDKHPYFQAIYPLILKLLKTNRKFQYQIFLEKTAVQLTGREILFEFINVNENAYQKTAYQVQSDMQNPTSIDSTSSEVKLSENETADMIKPDRTYERMDTSQNKSSSEKKDFNRWLKSTYKTKINREDNDQSAEKPQENLDLQNVSKPSKLVDKFIEKNPSITSPKKFESKKNNSSSREHSNSQMMTETLAKILIDQKKYDKAIEAYESLILNNPKKNSFFVSQIEKIKELKEKYSS